MGKNSKSLMNNPTQLPGWTAKVTEVSSGVYNIVLLDRQQKSWNYRRRYWSRSHL